MQLGLGLNLFDTMPLTFYKREKAGRRDDGQVDWAWSEYRIAGCLFYIDQPEDEEEIRRFNSTDRLTVYVPKGNDDIDFTGCLVSVNNKVYSVDGNSTSYMESNTPGNFNRVVYAYKKEDLSLPELPE